LPNDFSNQSLTLVSQTVADQVEGAGQSGVPAAPTVPNLAMPMTLVLLALSGIGWAVLAWMSIDMGHPFVQLAMPMSSNWSATNLLAILSMWAIMMAAMMLPAAMPMVVAFSRACSRRAEKMRLCAFVFAYLLVWSGFSALVTAAQWLLQDAGVVNPMIVSTSAGLTGVLLLLAGVYQFSPLKRVCLAHCRTPMGFLIGEWRSGVSGGLVMGLRHGLFCLGCCWALMALLFVGGVMNLAWVAALAIVAAVEKLMPRGEMVARVLGVGLIIAGAARLLAQLGG